MNIFINKFDSNIADEEKIISKIGTKNVESISIVNDCEEEEEVKDGINVSCKL